jgi:hypothetical protein
MGEFETIYNPLNTTAVLSIQEERIVLQEQVSSTRELGDA